MRVFHLKWSCTCTHTHARMHTRTHTHARMHSHTHTHTRMHSHTHAHKHTHINHIHTPGPGSPKGDILLPVCLLAISIWYIKLYVQAGANFSYQ